MYLFKAEGSYYILQPRTTVHKQQRCGDTAGAGCSYLDFPCSVWGIHRHNDRKTHTVRITKYTATKDQYEPRGRQARLQPQTSMVRSGVTRTLARRPTTDSLLWEVRHTEMWEPHAAGPRGKRKLLEAGTGTPDHRKKKKKSLFTLQLPQTTDI